MDELQAQLAAMVAAWTAGRPAADHAPAGWLEGSTDRTGVEPRLAAFAGHALETLFRPASPPDLEVRSPLPAVSGRIVPDAQRGRIRRLRAAAGPAASFDRVVRLLAARGFVVHPADWLPTGRDDWAPDVYAPWIAWADADARDAPEALTAETWADWSWAERKAALVDLRRRDPAAARALIAAKSGGEAAERRLALVQILEVRLGGDDLAVLASFASDRSDRVRLAAARLAARLGGGGDQTDAARELADMVRVERSGMLNRRTRLVFPPLKTAAQRSRRLELMRVVPLAALVRALDSAEGSLLQGAPDGGPAELQAFVQAVAETGSQDACERLFALLLEADGGVGHVAPLADRVPEDRRVTALPQVIRSGSALFEEAVAFAGPALGAVALRSIASAPAWIALQRALADARGGDEAARNAADTHLSLALPRLGLLLDRSSARTVVDLCTAEGLSPADPRLDLLHLNAALEPETTS